MRVLYFQSGRVQGGTARSDGLPRCAIAIIVVVCLVSSVCSFNASAAMNDDIAKNSLLLKVQLQESRPTNLRPHDNPV